MPLSSVNGSTPGNRNGRGEPAAGWWARKSSSGNARSCGWAVCVVGGMGLGSGWVAIGVSPADEVGGAGTVIGGFEPQATRQAPAMTARRFTCHLPTPGW